MSELFVNEKLNGPGLPAAGSIDLDTTQRDWQDCGTEGFWIKPLLEDQGMGIRTWLMKVDAGAFSPMHSHNEIEQIYVLEGSFYDQNKTYGPGAFIVRSVGDMHSAGSEEGALVLLFYSPAAE